MRVTPEDIKVISRLVDDLCGVVLDETKGYLIESRLSSVAKEAGCQTFTELYHRARYKNETALRNKIVDAVTTNETLFFRDTSPFEAMQHKVIPELVDARARTAFPKRLRIWSAACSTGQEPYSIAMTLHNLLPDIQTWDIRITATDISDAAVKQASLGRYREHEIRRGMRPDQLARHFVQQGSEWQAKDSLRALIHFQRRNLLEPLTSLGPFDIVLCRNVAIYFSKEVRADLFRRIARVMTEDGYLFVGSSESLSDVGPEFKPYHHCRAVFYQPNLKEARMAVSAR